MPKIYYKDVKFRLRKTKEIKDWIIKVIRSEGMEPGDLSFIFISDAEIKEINKEFLKHNYNTDVIAFDYREGNIINGEVYISIDTIKRNAKRFNSQLISEIMRVMIHGILHFVGYNDKNEIMQREMRERENLYLDRFNK